MREEWILIAYYWERCEFEGDKQQFEHPPVLKIRVCAARLFSKVLEALFLNGCNAIKLCVSVSYLPIWWCTRHHHSNNHNPLQLIKQCQTLALSDEMQSYQKIWLSVLLFFPPLLCEWIIPLGVLDSQALYGTETTPFLDSITRRSWVTCLNQWDSMSEYFDF